MLPQVTTDKEVDNCLRVLELHRVRYLVVSAYHPTSDTDQSNSNPDNRRYGNCLFRFVDRQRGEQVQVQAVGLPRAQDDLQRSAAARRRAHFRVLHRSVSVRVRVGSLTAVRDSEVGNELVRNLMADARTMLRWYILVCMGQEAGHLALGIGKASAASIILIPEDFQSTR